MGATMKVTTSNGRLTVANGFYTAALSAEGGRIVSLVCADGGAEFASSARGIAEDTECGFPGQMAHDVFRHEVLPAEGKAVRVRYTYHGRPGFFVRWSMTLVKTFTFLPDSPLITVEQTLRNAGEPELFAAFRIHNEVVPRPDSVMLVPTTAGLKTAPAVHPDSLFIADFTEALVGMWRRDTREALLFLPEYDAVSRFLVSTGKGLATLEWYYRRFTIGDNAAWTTSYGILPTALGTLDDLPAVLASVGVEEIDVGRRDRRAQAPLVVQRGGTEPRDREAPVRRFGRSVSRLAAHDAAFTTAGVEADVALPGGNVCSRAPGPASRRRCPTKARSPSAHTPGCATPDRTTSRRMSGAAIRRGTWLPCRRRSA